MTLCIIDMQPNFSASEIALVGVVKEVEKARKRREHIVVVEYSGHSWYAKTCKEIMDALKGYPKVAFVKKTNDDGSKEIISTLRKKNIPYSHLRICGVNLGACVFYTVQGLAKELRNTRITVPTKATACDGGFEWSYKNIKEMAHSYGNIKVL